MAEAMATLENIENIVVKSLKKPESYLYVQQDLASDLQQCTKLLYDLTAETCQKVTNALPELFIQGFDEEQIWQQVDLQNDGAITQFVTKVSRILAGHNEFKLPISLTEPSNEYLSDNESVEEDANELKFSENENKELHDDEANREEIKKQKKEVKRTKEKSSVVDDKFFKLQELHEYLTKEEKKVSRSKQSDESSGDESVDLFDSFSEGEDEDVKYADFFDSPESEEDNSSKRENMDDKTEEEYLSEPEKMLKPFKKKVKFNLSNDSDDTDSIENKGNREDESSEPKSSFKEREERLRKRIEQLEEENLAEKPWQLKGEVSAGNRPQNALLEDYLEVEVASRPPPVMTEQTTLKLEDIIKMRIKDKTWDDVEKKFKPVNTPLEYKKKLILDQEKSKQSLAEIYESEYLKQRDALDPDKKEDEEPEEPKEHTEIREMMHSLFAKLDALSNFHYTPKQAKPEIKIVSNVPAVNMEEVAPVATTDATLLAPEEVKGKRRGDEIGKSERTKTDMKRSRRRKKLHQGRVQKAKEIREKLGSTDPIKKKKLKLGKDKSAALIKEVTKARNVFRADESVPVAKSSTAFFEQLQEQAKASIHSKAAKTKKKDKQVFSAKKLKL